MDEFLKKRNLPQAVLDKLSEDKIDCEVVVLMTDDQLAAYVPSYGDRVALMAFAKTATRDKGSGIASSNIEERLKGMKRKNPIGNKNAEKRLRRVELGWVNLDHPSKKYKQVRSKNGGGTRQLTIEKKLSVSDVCELAKSTFFPEGRSKLGPLHEFRCEVRDFKGDELDDAKSIEEIYEESKLKMLRMYLYTCSAQKPRTSCETPFMAECSESSGDELPCISIAPRSVMASDQLAGTCNIASQPCTRSNDVSATTMTPPVTTSSLPSAAIVTDTACAMTTEVPRLATMTTTVAPACSGVDSGTPEVTFHPRHRLSLRRMRNLPSTSASCTTTRLQPEVVEVVDSEDEEIQQAIEASLLDISPEQAQTSSAEGVDNVLKELQGRAVQPDCRTKIIVFRSNILDSTLRALDRKNINLNARLYVKFSGEMGEDYGGPRREFFRLAIQAIHQSRFFEGPDISKVFTHDLDLLERKQYKLIGRLVALSLVQDGPGMHFLSGHLFDMMTGLDVNLRDAQLVLPHELNELIRQLEDVDNDEKRDSFLVEHGDQLIDQGFGNPYNMTIDSKGQMVHMLKKHYLYYRISCEINQFTEGMNEVSGAWDFVKTHARLFKPLFCAEAKQMSATEVAAIFEFKHSDEGTNSKPLEDVTVYAWELFLQSIEDGELQITFKELLAFTTGADNIPPCGFTKPIEIFFYNQESDAHCRLPSVSTCGLQMWLPRATNPDRLSELLIRAMRESGGFFKI